MDKGVAVHQFLSFSPLFAKSGKGESLFWPGCSAMKLGGDLILQVFLALRQSIPELCFSSWCCAKPTFAVGNDAQKSKRNKQLIESFAKSGVKQIYTLCPNCTITLSKFTEIKVIPAWELLAEYAKKNSIHTHIFQERFILHDPCTARNDAISQSAVREILRMRNISFAEFENCGKSTRCCGRKDMLFVTNPVASTKVLNKRIADTRGLPIVTYCESCVEAFRIGGHEAVHILEILFGNSVDRSTVNRIINSRRRGFHA